jgi:hypothetical protein
MRAIQASGRTGADGVLHLSIPVGTPETDFQVVVNLYPQMTDIDWHKFVEETAGSITDETFVRPPQCQHEKPPGS